MTATQQILEFINENLAPRGGPVGDDDSLFSAGRLDSFGLLELVNFVQKSLGWALEDFEIIDNNLDSVAAIVAYAEERERS
ncbi:MAG: acyl carrier protein [Bacillota bacterium]